MSETTVNLVSLMPGWYGKLPHLGDFAVRRLPEEFVGPWDGWLQRSLADARAELGTQWLDAYLVAPIQRFWLGPGVAGAAPWGGVMMSSVDRVGRYFPLTIAQPLESLALALAARDWYAALDGAARQVLDVHFTVEDLEAALAALPPAQEREADDAARRIARDLSDRLPDGTAVSVWWCDDASERTAFLCFAGLPPAEAFVALLGAAS